LKKRILVIDDNYAFLSDFVRPELQITGHSYVLKSDPQEALKIIKEYNMDIILCDLVMPILNGFDIFKELKKMDKKVVFVLMSATLDSDTINTAKDLGITEFLFKDLDLSKTAKDIIKIIQRLIV